MINRLTNVAFHHNQPLRNLSEDIYFSNTSAQLPIRKFVNYATLNIEEGLSLLHMSLDAIAESINLLTDVAFNLITFDFSNLCHDKINFRKLIEKNIFLFISHSIGIVPIIGQLFAKYIGDIYTKECTPNHATGLLSNHFNYRKLNPKKTRFALFAFELLKIPSKVIRVVKAVFYHLTTLPFNCLKLNTRLAKCQINFFLKVPKMTIKAFLSPLNALLTDPQQYSF